MTRQVTFVGNPNVGKSAWINALSDAQFKVGNWPGVTIEKKYADVIWDGEAISLIDLPGTYALSDAQNEEGITARYLKEEAVDLIVNVVDATNLSRNLYLTLALRRLQKPMILILNFMDEVEKYKMRIEVDELSKRLEIPIYAYSAFDRAGAKNIRNIILQQLHQPKHVSYSPYVASHEEDTFELFYHRLRKHLPGYIEMGDQELDWFVYDAYVQVDNVQKQLDSWHVEIRSTYQGTSDEHLFQCVQDLMQYVHSGDDRLALTRKVDAIALHPIWGSFILCAVFVVMMLLVFQGSAPFNDFIDFFIHDMVMKYANAIFSFLPEGAKALLLNGILAGVGGVLVFLPLMFFLYFFLSLLEESGYMARIAFLLDHFMQHFHLNGKSFVAFLLGFGCNVPAIYATRTLDNEKQRKMSALLVPFMSCGARLPVYMLFAAAFFHTKAAVMVLSVYGIGIFIALIVALIISRFQSFHDDHIFVIELPPYRKPSFPVILQKVKQEVCGYIKKAMSVVLWAMVVLWAISYFPNGRVEDSYLAQGAKSVSFLYEPLGFGTRWESVAALPGSIVAKETVVGFFGQVMVAQQAEMLPSISPMEDGKTIANEAGQTLRRFLTSWIPSTTLPAPDDTLVHTVSTLWEDDLASLRAYSYMVYILLSIPCVMTLQAIGKEYGVWMMLLSVALMVFIPYLVSLLIFQGFSFFFFTFL